MKKIYSSDLSHFFLGENFLKLCSEGLRGTPSNTYQTKLDSSISKSGHAMLHIPKHTGLTRSISSNARRIDTCDGDQTQGFTHASHGKVFFSSLSSFLKIDK